MRLTKNNNTANIFLARIAELSSPVRFKADIPMDDEVKTLAAALRAEDPNAEVYAVGGAVRDYLFNHFNGQGSEKKDIDLTTNLSEDEIVKRLQKAGIAVKEKESAKKEGGQAVNTFGVVFAFVNGKQYEIAPFRKDIGGDGRRPERVEQASIEEDAQRRDLTMNNLYYDFDKKEILDFNPNGQGIEDIKNGVARPVGDAHERFNEDKLRVLRLVRFFSMVNDGSALDHLDEKTLAAINHFKDLRNFGLTEERIAGEFVSGLNKAKNISSYLKNYSDLGLLDSVFSGMGVDVEGAGILDGLEKKEGKLNTKVALAWLLRNNSDVIGKLLKLKYSRDVAESVQFLIDCLKLSTENSFNMVKRRDKLSSSRGDLIEFASIIGGVEGEKLKHLAGYEMKIPSGEELMGRGLKGIELGKEQQRAGREHYENDYGNHVTNNNKSFPGKENILAEWLSNNCKFAKIVKADFLPESDISGKDDDYIRSNYEHSYVPDLKDISNRIPKEVADKISKKYPSLNFLGNGYFGAVYRNNDRPGWLIKVTTDDSERNAAEIQIERKLSCIVPVLSCQELSTDKGEQIWLIETKEVERIPKSEYKMISEFAKYYERNTNMNFLGIKPDEFRGNWSNFLKFVEMCNCLKANGMSINDAVYGENMGKIDGRYVTIDLGFLI